jgi:hypothetical protein
MFGMSQPTVAFVTVVIDRGLKCVSHLISFPSERNIYFQNILVASRNAQQQIIPSKTADQWDGTIFDRLYFI